MPRTACRFTSLALSVSQEIAPLSVAFSACTTAGTLPSRRANSAARLAKSGARVRTLARAVAGGIAMAIVASAPAQPQREGKHRPSAAEALALVDCEQAVLGEAAAHDRIRTGIYDVSNGNWLIVGEKRDEIIACLVGKHRWAALSAPDGRRGARAPR